MGPPSYMQSVVDRNVVMRRITVVNERARTSEEATGLTSKPFWIFTNRKIFFHRQVIELLSIQPNV